MSVRAVSRITGMHKTTILSLAADRWRAMPSRFRCASPKHPARDLFRPTSCGPSFTRRNATLVPDDPEEWGDTYIWMAIDSETKLVLSYHVGKRDAASAYEFIRDLSERVTGRFQITTDGFKAYIPAIEE